MLTMRAMAWAKIKGELDAFLQTYWGEDERFPKVSAEVKNFVETLDDLTG